MSKTSYRVLLLRTRPDPETIGLQHMMVCEPLELEYLSTYLKADGHEVHLVDLILEKEPAERFFQRIQPDVVLLSGYITQVHILKRTARLAKSLVPGCLVGVGGVHAEVVPGDFDDPCFDAVFSEDPIPSLRRYLGTTEEALERPVPFRPDRRITAAYRSQYYYLFHRPCALIKTATGCPQQCAFCFCREITGGTYHPRALDGVIEELKTIEEREVYIVDDDFLVSRERVLDFCDRLDAAGIHKRFLIYGRADFIAANADVIRRFKKSGLRAVIVGLESVRKADLEKFKKGSGAGENERAIEVLHQEEVDLYGTLILDMDFTREDFRALTRWLCAWDVRMVNLQPLTPLPGTGLFPGYADRLRVDRKEHAKWDLAHLVLSPDHLSPRRFYYEMIRCYLRVSFAPRHLWRLIRRHGIGAVLRMGRGTSRVTRQYLAKMIKGV
jgi:radical SAM superfamily enzyme YgiQ (UPF0313 family)